MLSLAVIILYIALAEYSLHRWAMHRHVFGRNSFWHDHAVEHHAKGNVHATLNLPLWLAHLICLPLYLLCLRDGWLAFTEIEICAIGYAFLWTSLHHSIHDVDRHWLRRVPGYASVRKHHLDHHASPRSNFSTIFPIMDRLFGTRHQ